MKKLVLIVLLMPLGLKAQNWDANANSGTWRDYFQTVNFQDCETTTNNPAITAENFSGLTGKVWKQTCPVKVQRNEFSRTENFTHRINQNYYYSWRVRMSHSDNLNSNRFAIFQWKTTGAGSQNHPITMAWQEGKLFLYYFYPCKTDAGNFKNWSGQSGCSSNDRRFTLKEINVSKDTWVEIVLRIQRGNNETGSGAGKVQLWINGQLQTLNNPYGSPSKNIQCKTDDADNQVINDASVYPKWGVYGGNKCPFGITSRIHNLKAYNNWQDAVSNLVNSRPSSAGKNASEKTSSQEPLFSDLQEKSVSVFPNPARDVFSINLKGFKSANVEIADLLGKVVYTISTEEDTVQLSKGTTFTSGLYIIKVTDNQNKIFTNKLVVK